MALMTDTRLAEILGITPHGVMKMKKTAPERYELLRLGTIQKEAGISSAELELFVNFKNELKSLEGDGK